MNSKSKLTIALFFTLVLATSALEPVVFKDCGTAANKATITSMSIVPNPPVLGSNFTASGNGMLLTTVTGGHYNVIVTFAGIQVIDHTGPVCGPSAFPLPLGLGIVEVTALTCPATPGPVGITTKIPVSKYAPSGAVVVSVHSYDQAGDALMCYTLNFDF